jgi:hypothetical protein
MVGRGTYEAGLPEQSDRNVRAGARKGCCKTMWEEKEMVKEK